MNVNLMNVSANIISWNSSLDLWKIVVRAKNASFFGHLKFLSSCVNTTHECSFNTAIVNGVIYRRALVKEKKFLCAITSTMIWVERYWKNVLSHFCWLDKNIIRHVRFLAFLCFLVLLPWKRFLYCLLWEDVQLCNKLLRKIFLLS